MGMFDFLGSSGQEAGVVMPEYQEYFGNQVGERGRNFLNDFYANNPTGLTSGQNNALDAMRRTALQGKSAGAGANGWLNNLVSTNGLNSEQQALASNLTTGKSVNPAMAETQRIAMGGDVGNNPWLDKSYNQAAGRITDNFNQSVIPGLDTQFAASGRLGSGAYARLRNQGEKQLGQTLSDTATSMYGNAYNSDMAAKNAALTQLGGLGQQHVQNQLAGAGLYNQGTANVAQGVGMGDQIQNLRYDDYNRLYNAETQQTEGFWNQMRAGGNMMGGLQSGQATAGQQGVSGAGQAAQLAATAASIYMMSDRRLKRDVTEIGRLPSGLPLYTYRYVWDAPEVWRVGVMAQDALELIPSAVAAHPSGYLMVDYAQVR